MVIDDEPLWQSAAGVQEATRDRAELGLATLVAAGVSFVSLQAAVLAQYSMRPGAEYVWIVVVVLSLVVAPIAAALAFGVYRAGAPRVPHAVLALATGLLVGGGLWLLATYAPNLVMVYLPPVSAVIVGGSVALALWASVELRRRHRRRALSAIGAAGPVRPDTRLTPGWLGVTAAAVAAVIAVVWQPIHRALFVEPGLGDSMFSALLNAMPAFAGAAWAVAVVLLAVAWGSSRWLHGLATTLLTAAALVAPWVALGAASTPSGLELVVAMLLGAVAAGITVIVGEGPYPRNPADW